MGISKLLPTLESVSRKVTFKGAHHYKVDANHSCGNNAPPGQQSGATRTPLSMQEMIRNISRKRQRQSQTQATQDSTNEDEKEDLRYLRIGVDVSTWIAAACHGNGAELLDERHLSSFGRFQLQEENFNRNQREKEPQRKSTSTATEHVQDAKMQEQIQTFIKMALASVMRKVKSVQYLLSPSILIVLDGASPPVKKDVVEDRKKGRSEAAKKRDTLSNHARSIDMDIDELEQDANKKRISSAKKAGAATTVLYSAIVTAVLATLREEKIAFMISPYEADSQLTYLCNNGYIDFIISEDSDFIPYGANAVFFKYKPCIPFDAGFKQGFTEESFKNCTASATLILKKDLGACSSTSFSLLGFTDVMIAMVCVAAGCDYSPSLKGIGLVHARNAVDEAFAVLGEKLYIQGTFIDRALRGLFARCHGTLTKEQQDQYMNSFIRALVMLRHPVVFDPICGKCIFVNIDSPDKELIEFKPYADIVGNDTKLQSIVGGLFEREMAIYVSEGWINPKNWLLRNEENETPAAVVRYWRSAKARKSAKEFEVECDRINGASQSPHSEIITRSAQRLAQRSRGDVPLTTSPMRSCNRLSQPSQSTTGTSSASKPSTQGSHRSNISAEILSPVLL
jgi:5'-3' exonuclease